MFTRHFVLIAAMALAAEGQASAWNTEAGEFGVDFRYRLEYVDQDAYQEDALASTLRTRVNFTSKTWNAFSLFVEGDYVANLGPDDYNESAGNTPDRVRYPVVADPSGPDLNQLYLQYKSDPVGTLRLGRQRIIYDNARFIGSVGWRQNEQTYDAVSFQRKWNEAVELQLAWLDNVNRIFGNDVPAGDQEQNTWLGNLAWNPADGSKLVGYIYDLDNEDAAASSTLTFGAYFEAKRKFDSKAWRFRLEYAHQTDAHNNPVDFSADYYRADLEFELDKVSPFIAYESLEGDESQPGASFRTPLATLHAFNGWADKFLATPEGGLVDWMIGLKAKAGGMNWQFVYHDFDAESGSASFGHELDASVSRDINEHFSILLKAAWFDGKQDAPFDDTFKAWLQLSAKL